MSAAGIMLDHSARHVTLIVQTLARLHALSGDRDAPDVRSSIRQIEADLAAARARVDFYEELTKIARFADGIDK
jgi:hypothetical protein